MKRVTQILALAATAMAAVGYAREPKANLESVAIEHGDHSGTVSRACAVGFKNLRAFFDSKGALFVPELVSSHKGLYCHVFYEPTIAGFRVSASQDPVAAMLFDEQSVEAQEWARSLAGASVGTPQLLPIPSTAVADPVWSRAMLGGQVGGRAVLLHAKSPRVEHAMDVLPVRVAVSRLPWDANDFLIVRDKDDHQRTILLYGDQSRHRWAGLRDEESAYLFRVEFGVNAAAHLPTGQHLLTELLGSEPTGNVKLSSLIAPHESRQIQHLLTRAGLPISQMTEAVGSAIPNRAIVVRTEPQ